MTPISFIIPTSGADDAGLNKIIDSIEILAIPIYEVIIIGGPSTGVNRKNTIHIPFDETARHSAWTSKKKNDAAKVAKNDVLVIMHDYHTFDPNWYEEFEKFGTDWDICVTQTFGLPSQGGKRANGWRAGPIPGYPEIPFAMTIPWDIDCFIPYMAIQGSFWVCKKSVMLEEPLNENMIKGDIEDIEWSSRVVPGWLGEKPNQNKYKIVANPNCITRFTKEKPLYPGPFNMFEDAIKSLEWLWDFLRQGNRRPGVYHYERSSNSIEIRK
jgi:hypothetical protein